MYLVAAALAFAGFTAMSYADLLKNGSFEEGAINPENAQHWRMNEPDDHGDSWGNAIRTDWRAHDGSFIGAVRGAWAGMGEYGGFWQEAMVSPGTTCRATAWFWADENWIAEVQEFKIEFWNEDRSEKLDEKSIALHDVSELWTQRAVEAVAPEDTAWARVVLNVSGVGNDGALQVDAISLSAGDTSAP